ncbi:IclR family transcriptional regulator [Paremcibacter congregatus]|uniref:IclR family transcriptional regulator n=1 Tax=Paremcibacter congregatus TaxID=2043170 RepID=UPI003A95B51A
MTEKVIGKGQVQSLTRAFSLLECVADAGIGLNLSQVAAKMDLAPSTVHRLLNAMKDRGYFEVDPATGLWSVGLQAFRVGNGYLQKRDFVTQARPYMKKLVAEVGETTSLAVLDGDQMTFIAQVECREVMRMSVPLGNRVTLYASAVGKMQLAALSDAEAVDLMKDISFAPLTERTHASLPGLLAEVQDIRRKGFAVDEQEQSLGMRCVAAAIYNEHHEAVAFLTIAGPTVRLKQKNLNTIGKTVRALADEVTRTIGGREKDET